MGRIVKNILGQLGYVNIHGAEDGTAPLDVLRREKINKIFEGK
jgi:hypothetical protein